MKAMHWRRSLRARAATFGVGVGALVVSALLNGGAPPVPFSAKNVATVASDSFGTSIAATPTGLQAVAMGPSHTVYTYWETNGTWYGPLQIGAPGTAYSGPFITQEVTGSSANNGNLDVAVEGQNHTLNFFWFIQASNTWYGPLQIGAAGSTYSAPALTQDQAGNVDVAAQGPNGTLWFYWSIGGSWHGPFQVAGPGQLWSRPSMDNVDTGGCSSQQACIGVGTLGPSNQSIVYFDNGGNWLAPVRSGTGQEYSSPNTHTREFGWEDSYEGPQNSLIDQTATKSGGTNAYCVIGSAGTTYSASTTFSYSAGASTTSSGGTAYNIGVLGPSNALYVFWHNTSNNAPSKCDTWYGPLQLSGAGTAWSVPAAYSAPDANGNSVTNIVFEGPSNTLWDVYSSNGTWYGPIQLGRPGSTFASNS